MVFVLLFLLNLDMVFADRVDTVTIFNNCPSKHNSVFQEMKDFLYRDDFKIQRELVYEFCGVTCRNKGTLCYNNDYLQDKLVLPVGLRGKYPNYEDQELNRSLDPRCTYRVLKIAKDSSGSFLDCESFNDPNPETRLLKEQPCLSKRFHHALHQSITEISSCFRIDPKLFFAIIAKESKGHPLSKNSGSSAVGMGQLLKVLIEEYSDTSHTTFDVLKDEVLPLLSQQNGACRIVHDKISQFSKLDKDSLCQRTHYYMNMVYTMMSLVDSISKLTPVVIKGQGKSFKIPENSPFQSLIDKYASDLDKEKDRRSEIQSALRDVRNSNNSDSPHTNSVSELNSNLEDSNDAIYFLKERGRFFRNLARFQGLNANDKKLVSELSIYWHLLPRRTSTLFQTYIDDGRSLDFEDFTGHNGQWVRFLNMREIRGQINDGQNNFIGFIHPQGGASPNNSSMMEMLDHIEREQRPNIFPRCRPY